MDDKRKAFHYDAAHGELDSLGIPRKDEHEQLLTVAGRIMWLKESFPELANSIHEKRKREMSDL